MLMELPTLPTPTPEKVSAGLTKTPAVHEMYERLPFSADPKKSLINTGLKRLDLLPLGDLVDELLRELLYGNEQARTTAATKYEAREVEILKAFETDTHVALVEGTDYRYQATVLQHCADLIKEYDCTTPSEKALCEFAAMAFVRHLSYTRKLKDLADESWSLANRRTRRPTRHYMGEQEETWYLASDHIRHINATSKEIDRAQRQYQTAIGQLAQMKSPVPEVHIKTAFMAQNQQINVPRTP